MAERLSDGWLVEQGIGEERAICYHQGQPFAARLRWPGGLESGAIVTGRLVTKLSGLPRGLARFPSGEEALVDKLPGDASEGADMRFLVTRSTVAETNRRKPAQVRPSEEAERPAPSLLDTLPGARPCRRFPGQDWDEIVELAADGIVPFPGGSLQFTPTPAMVLVDVDGHLPPPALATACVMSLARGLRLLGIGGSVGVDFPTLAAKADRKAVDTALAEALAGIDHERTAMNGFGFVQIVSRFERPSLLHLWQARPAGAAARWLLRQAEALEGPGRIELSAHPEVLASLSAAWLAELQRRAGREVVTRADSALAISAPHAQLVPL